jgi:integrase
MPSDRIPKHSRHASGQGRIVLSGQTHYTGPWGPDPGEPSPECRRRAEHLVGLWLQNGRRPIRGDETGETVGSLCRGYTRYAEARYRKRGEPTRHAETVGHVCRMVEASHGRRTPEEFGPKALRQLRRGWLSGGLRGTRSRSTAARYAAVVVEMFRWAVAEEMIPVECHTRLRTLEPLTERDAGRKDPPRKASPPRGAVDAAIAGLKAPACDILRLLDVSGMRASEACSMRLRDLDRSGDVWAYEVDPDWNKESHAGRRRVVYLGPRARAILAPYVAKAESAGGRGWLFRPRIGKNSGKDVPYRGHSLCIVLGLWLKRRGLPHWHPHQLRHSHLSNIYRAFGVQSARSVAGHSDARTTMIYVDPDAASAEEREAARRAALELG